MLEASTSRPREAARGERAQQHRGAEVVVGDVVGDVAEVDAEADHRRLVADRVDARDRARDRVRVAHVALDRARRAGRGSPAARGARPAGARRARAPRGPRSSSASTTCEPMKPAPPVTRITGRAQATVSRRVPDVILPVLNEREALPWVLERMPAGYAPIVVDNGSTDGSGELAAALGARVVREPRPGLRRRVLRRADARRTSDVVCFMDCDASFDPRELPRVADPVARRRRRPDARRAPPDRARRLAAARPRGQRACSRSSCGAAPASPLRDLGPMRAARREALLGLGIRDRRFGWPLEMVLRAAGGRLDDPRGRRRLPPARRAARRSPAPCAAPSRAVRDMTKSYGDARSE